jgi:hypothetical protein
VCGGHRYAKEVRGQSGPSRGEFLDVRRGSDEVVGRTDAGAAASHPEGNTGAASTSRSPPGWSPIRGPSCCLSSLPRRSCGPPKGMGYRASPISHPVHGNPRDHWPFARAVARKHRESTAPAQLSPLAHATWETGCITPRKERVPVSHLARWQKLRAPATQAQYQIDPDSWC